MPGRTAAAHRAAGGAQRRVAPLRSISASRCASSVPCRCQSPALPGDQPAAGQPRQRVGDRRALGRHELAEQPVRERQREADPGRLDPAPARRQVPEQERRAAPRAAAGTRSRAARRVVGAPARPGAAARARSAATAAPARRTPRRAARTGSATARARRRAARAVVRARPGRLQQVAGAGNSDTVRSPTRVVERDERPRGSAGRDRARPRGTTGRDRTPRPRRRARGPWPPDGRRPACARRTPGPGRRRRRAGSAYSDGDSGRRAARSVAGGHRIGLGVGRVTFERNRGSLSRSSTLVAEPPDDRSARLPRSMRFR